PRVGGRQEGVERGRDRSGREHERSRHPAGRPGESRFEIAVSMPLRAITDAELDAEIDAEADEENSKRNRDRVERSHHPQPDGGLDKKSDNQIDEDGENDGRLLGREPQHEADEQQRYETVQGRPVRDAVKFVVRQDDRSGETHLHAVAGREPEPGYRLSY